MGATEAKIANHTYRTTELLEKILAEAQRINQILDALYRLQAPANPTPRR